MYSFWVIMVTYDSKETRVSSDAYAKLEDAKESLNSRLGGDVHWISDFICRQIINDRVIYYELFNISIVR